MLASNAVTKTDVVVVGAGVMGASIAFQLSRLSNLNVVVVDKTGPLGGMSGRTFGQVRQHYSNALTLEMARFGIDHFSNWQTEVSIGSSGYVPMGYLLTVKAGQFDAARRNVELARGLGIETRFIDADEIAQFEPTINAADLEGAAWDPAGGFIDVTRITLGWFAAAELSQRVRIFGDCAVEGFLTQGSRIKGVETSRGRIEADHVVVAAGPWSKSLLETLDLDVPLESRRLDTMYLSLPKAANQLRTCVTDGTSNIVVRPDMGAQILAAAYPSEMELVDDPMVVSNAASDDAHFARIETALEQRFPSFLGAEPVRPVSGAYDITPDWHPILGRVAGLEGLQLAFGFSGHGLKLSPAVGRVLADQILDRKPLFDFNAVRLERFAEGEPMFLAYGPGGRA